MYTYIFYCSLYFIDINDIVFFGGKEKRFLRQSSNWSIVIPLKITEKAERSRKLVLINGIIH